MSSPTCLLTLLWESRGVPARGWGARSRSAEGTLAMEGPGTCKAYGAFFTFLWEIVGVGAWA